MQREHQRILNGRQIYCFFLYAFHTTVNMGTYYSITNFMQLEWIGDDLQRMEQFRNNWSKVVNLQQRPIEDVVKAEMLHRILGESKLLKSDVDAYTRSVYDSGGTHDLQALLTILDRHIHFGRERANERAFGQQHVPWRDGLGEKYPGCACTGRRVGQTPLLVLPGGNVQEWKRRARSPT